MQLLLLLGGAVLLLLALGKNEKGAVGAGEDAGLLPGDRPTLEDLPPEGTEGNPGFDAFQEEINQYRLRLERRILELTGRAVKLTSTTPALLADEYLRVMARLSQPVPTAPVFEPEPFVAPTRTRKFELGQLVRGTAIPRILETPVLDSRWDSGEREYVYLLQGTAGLIWVLESALEAAVEQVDQDWPWGTNKFNLRDEVQLPTVSKLPGTYFIDDIRWTGSSWNYHLFGQLNFWGENTLRLVQAAMPSPLLPPGSEPQPTPKYTVGTWVITTTGIWSKITQAALKQNGWAYLLEDDPFTWWREDQLRRPNVDDELDEDIDFLN